MQAAVLNNIAGMIYRNKGELDKALGYYEESLRLQTDEKEKATTYNNIAIIYVDKGELSKGCGILPKGDRNTAKGMEIITRFPGET
jgi:tetratricopeptide (TPR) repeat protein